MKSACAYLAAAALGLLSGAMLLLATAIVPFWSSLDPTDFAHWFRAYSPLLGRVMLPLGISATVLAVLAAWLSRPVSAPAFRWWAIAAALAVMVAALYPLYFVAANAALAGGALGPEEITLELQRWRVWHWIRTALGSLAFLAGLRALGQRR